MTDDSHLTPLEREEIKHYETHGEMPTHIRHIIMPGEIDTVVIYTRERAPLDTRLREIHIIHATLHTREGTTPITLIADNPDIGYKAADLVAESVVILDISPEEPFTPFVDGPTAVPLLGIRAPWEVQGLYGVEP